MAKIDIRGAIVPDGEQWIYDWYGIPAVSPKRIMQQIERATANHDKELIVNINSNGGSVYAASEIYAHIKKFPGDSVSEITGVCASAASIIMTGTKRTVIAPVGAVMIHNASVVAQGDYRDMEAMKQLLMQTNQAIMQTYIAKTGKSEEELTKMMNDETWMNAQQALEHGFVDEIMFENEIPITASDTDIASNGLLPKEVIDKMRNLLASDPNILVKNNASKGIPNEPEPGKEPEAKGDTEIMDLNELNAKHPDLVEQIKNDAGKEAITAERKRVQAIDDITPPGMENLANKAKFESGITAEQFAVEVLKAQKEQTQTQMQNRVTDAAPLNQIAAPEAPANNNKDAEVNNLLDKVFG